MLAALRISQFPDGTLLRAFSSTPSKSRLGIRLPLFVYKRVTMPTQNEIFRRVPSFLRQARFATRPIICRGVDVANLTDYGRVRVNCLGRNNRILCTRGTRIGSRCFQREA